MRTEPVPVGSPAGRGKARLLHPDAYYTSVHAIPLDELKALGVRGMLIDLDNTLLPRDTNVVPDGLKAWAADLRSQGFAVCLVSNNWHERVQHVADELGFALVDKAVKPLPFAFRRGLACLGTTARDTVVVGDQLFTDILGGNLLGMRTLLVQPLSSTDLPHTLVLRALESRVLKGRIPQG